MTSSAQLLHWASDAGHGFATIFHFLELAEDLLLSANPHEGEEIVRSVLWVVFSLKVEKEFFEAMFVRDLHGYHGPIFRDVNISLIVLKQFFHFLNGNEVVADVLKDVFAPLAEAVSFSALNVLDTVMVLLYRFEFCINNCSHAAPATKAFFYSLGKFLFFLSFILLLSSFFFVLFLFLFPFFLSFFSFLFLPRFFIK